MSMVKSRQILYIIVSSLAGGCASLGPRTVERVHSEYNAAIAKTEDEQMLLNIVRLKYRDNPFFLYASSVNESRKFTTRLGPSGSKFGLVDNAHKHELGFVAYSEIFQNPNITYGPLRGEDFTKRLMAPIPTSVLLGLMETGWSAKRIFSTCVERLNGLDNGSSASGPTPERAPDNKTFEEAVDLIDTLHGEKRLLIGLNSTSEDDLTMKFTASDAQSQKLKSTLGIDPGSSEFHFSANFLSANKTDLVVRTRSLMEVLFYLSHAVAVPQKDIDAGLVTVTRDGQGEIFDWSQSLSGKWITIDHSEQRPKNASVSVFYRGKWFFIADNNLNAKSTFMFLNFLFNLQSGNAKVVAPVLTFALN
jgi:hypothetical protein